MVNVNIGWLLYFYRVQGPIKKLVLEHFYYKDLMKRRKTGLLKHTVSALRHCFRNQITYYTMENQWIIVILITNDPTRLKLSHLIESGFKFKLWTTSNLFQQAPFSQLGEITLYCFCFAVLWRLVVCGGGMFRCFWILGFLPVWVFCGATGATRLLCLSSPLLLCSPSPHFSLSCSLLPQNHILSQNGSALPNNRSDDSATAALDTGHHSIDSRALFHLPTSPSLASTTPSITCPPSPSLLFAWKAVFWSIRREITKDIVVSSCCWAPLLRRRSDCGVVVSRWATCGGLNAHAQHCVPASLPCYTLERIPINANNASLVTLEGIKFWKTHEGVGGWIINLWWIKGACASPAAYLSCCWASCTPPVHGKPGPAWAKKLPRPLVPSAGQVVRRE